MGTNIYTKVTHISTLLVSPYYPNTVEQKYPYTKKISEVFPTIHSSNSNNNLYK